MKGDVVEYKEEPLGRDGIKVTADGVAGWVTIVLCKSSDGGWLPAKVANEGIGAVTPGQARAFAGLLKHAADLAVTRDMARRRLKVFAWTGYHRASKSSGGQARIIVAARSRAAAATIAGKKVSSLWNLGVTGNEQEMRVAMSSPGTMFWVDLNHYPRADADWKETTQC